MNDLQLLVEAVVGAHEHDEADWLEWKSSLDLGSKAGCFAVVRAILGMANRIPDRAALSCGGLGYVVVGAEPGSLVGLESTDPATFDQTIEPYVGGAEGPRWSPTYVVVEGKRVLVITVEAPRLGDRIFTLRREFDRALSAAVFVRKPGRTVPADASDQDALQSRLVASQPSGAALEVSIVGDNPMSWIDGQAARDAIDAWAGEQHDLMISAARAIEQARAGRGAGTGGGFSAANLDNPAWAHLERIQKSAAQQLAGALGSMQTAGLVGKPDGRSFDEFVTLVDDWRERLMSSAAEALPARYFAAGHGVFQLQVTNLAGRFLADLQVDLQLEWDGATILEQVPSEVELPDPPRPFGEPSPPPIAALGLSPSLVSSPYFSGLWNQPNPARRTRVDQGTLRITFHVGNLRQGADDKSEPCFLWATSRPESGIVRGTWKASIRDPDEVLAGTLDLVAADASVATTPLLEAGLEDDD